MIPPTLTTARLTLSPPEASDFEDLSLIHI